MNSAWLRAVVPYRGQDLVVGDSLLGNHEAAASDYRRNSAARSRAFLFGGRGGSREGADAALAKLGDDAVVSDRLLQAHPDAISGVPTTLRTDNCFRKLTGP